MYLVSQEPTGVFTLAVALLLLLPLPAFQPPSTIFPLSARIHIAHFTRFLVMVYMMIHVRVCVHMTHERSSFSAALASTVRVDAALLSCAKVVAR